MYKKWKSVAALGMAVLIGCMMPMSTMMAAAEDSQEDVQEIDSDSDDEAISVGENAGDEENVDDENVSDEVNSDEDENTGDEVKADEENADDEISAGEDEYVDEEVNTDNDGIALMSEAGGAETGDIETLASTAAPVITITFQGQDYTRSLGGEIVYKYVNNHDLAFECSADQETAKLTYCLDEFAGTIAEAKGAEQIDSWTEVSSSSIRTPLSADKSYVLYVKAVGADGQTTYARSGGIVVDTTPPNVSNLVDGGTYPEGTTFQVSETNLESVKVNEVLVNPESDGSYRVSANGTSTSCVVKVKDKAGNETTYSITISKDPAEDGIISKSGTYSLKANVKYQLGEGQWQVGGDKSVYSGGSTFYVKTSGDYTFTKC